MTQGTWSMYSYAVSKNTQIKFPLVDQRMNFIYITSRLLSYSEIDYFADDRKKTLFPYVLTTVM